LGPDPLRTVKVDRLAALDTARESRFLMRPSIAHNHSLACVSHATD